jgi:hypothetical protein
MPAALRPENSPDGGFRGGAIAGEGKSSIHSIISQKKDTGMERGTRRARQGKNRRRNRPGEGAVLGMADGGACGGEVRRLR